MSIEQWDVVGTRLYAGEKATTGKVPLLVLVTPAFSVETVCRSVRLAKNIVNTRSDNTYAPFVYYFCPIGTLFIDTHLECRSQLEINKREYVKAKRFPAQSF